jgi:imidazolonepropionase-like amidohydrolase
MSGVGALAPGSWGDLIGVPGDPLSDLRLLSEPANVRLVVKGGDVVKRSLDGVS